MVEAGGSRGEPKFNATLHSVVIQSLSDPARAASIHQCTMRGSLEYYLLEIDGLG